MKLDFRFADKIKHAIGDSKHVVLYGTGLASDRLFPYFEMLGILDRFIAVVDRPDSKKIGELYFGKKILRLEQVIDDADLILIGSQNYWKEIEERIKKYLIIQKKDIDIVAIYNFEPVKVRDNSSKDYIEYVRYLEESKNDIRSHFVEESHTPYLRDEGDPKLIAWYLPQYYRMSINDKFHGKGFTEWTSASQGMPFFVGHVQPHIPYDVGFYDLSNVDNMKRQVELAKTHGIYGFCFHYYWFSAEKTMEIPVEQYLEHKEIDFPFCLNWATENWTSVWDGGKYDLIFEQRTSEEDAEAFVNDLLPFLEDERYIKVKGKPLLMVYTVLMFSKKKWKRFIKKCKKILSDIGGLELYIVISNYRGFDEPVQEYLADALVEYPPCYMGGIKKKEISGYLNPYFDGNILDLHLFVENQEYLRKWKNEKFYRAAMTGFDNTARKPRWGGNIFIGEYPKDYKVWLKDIINENKFREIDDNIIFINSWNEWAEGCHLEPDIRNGYMFLEATKEAIYECRDIKDDVIDNKINDIVQEGLIPEIYVFCMESLGDIVACEPIARFIKTEYPVSNVNWIVKICYADLLKYNPYIDKIVTVESLGEGIDYCERKREEHETVIVDCHYDGRRCTVTGRYHINLINPQINESTYFHYGGLLESFSLIAGMKKISLHPNFYIGDPIIEERKDYVVFHCKSAEECKDWQREKWISLAESIIQKGYHVVEIGFEPVIGIEDQGYVDATKNNDLQYIAQLIKNAYGYIGIDSGFAHIANCFKKNALILMGKYKCFTHPMPYTGYYFENKEKVILYSKNENEDVKCISISDVEKKLENSGFWKGE